MRFFLTTAFGRVGIAMYSLGVLLTALSGYADYRVAGLVSGSFAAGEVAGALVLARVVDRRGQQRVLPVLGPAHLAAMSVLLATVHAAAPVGLTVAAAMAAGGSVPQLGAYAAARWSHRWHGDPRIRRALAMESAANDVAFLAGPALVSLLPRLVGLPLAVGVVVGAVGLLAVQRGSAPPASGTARSPGDRGLPGRLRGLFPRNRRLRVPVPGLFPENRALGMPAGALIGRLGVVNLLLGMVFGGVQLGVAALAGGGPSAGLLYFAMSVGSLASSILAGLSSRRIPGSPLVLAGAVALSVSDIPALDVAALFVTGSGVAPIIIRTATLIEQCIAAGAITQAFAVMAALSAAGSGVGAAVGGALVAVHGHAGPFALVAAIGAALCLTGRGLRGESRRESGRGLLR